MRISDWSSDVCSSDLYDAQGADELCFLDITASHEGRGTILDVVARTASVCFMPLTVGGGVRSVEDARALLLAGADKVAVNSAAVARPELVGEMARQRSEEHTSELQSLMRISYAVFCLKKKTNESTYIDYTLKHI